MIINVYTPRHRVKYKPQISNEISQPGCYERYQPTEKKSSLKDAKKLQRPREL